MRLQPNRNYASDDVVMTPRPLARALVRAVQPTGVILEPCAGDGAFLEALPPDALWCEITRGRDFFAFGQRVDWIITNPPWRQIRAFLRHAFELADNVAFLMTVNHAWTRARVGDARAAGFAIAELILVNTPRSFPPSGFQLGLIVYRRGWSGGIRLQHWDEHW